METVKDIAVRFNISRETVRIWAKEFASYLSPTANPSKGNQRNFDDEDLSVFALIAEMKGQGNTFEDIHASLQAGQRGHVPLMNPPSVGDGKTTVTALQRDLAQVARQRDEYHSRMLKAEGAAEELRDLIATKDAEIAHLNREIGRLQARIQASETD